MSVEVLDQLMSAQMAASTLLGQPFVAHEYPALVSLYHYCANIAQTYDLDFTYNSIVAKEDVKPLDTKKEEVVQPNSQMDLVFDPDAYFDPFEDQHPEVMPNNTQLSFDNQHDTQSNPQIVSTWNPSESVDISEYDFFRNETKEESAAKWEPSDYHDAYHETFHCSFEPIDQEEDLAHNQMELDFNYTGLSDNAEIDSNEDFECECADDTEILFDQEIMVNSGEVAKQLGQKLDKICEPEEENHRDYVEDTLESYWEQSGCSYEEYAQEGQCW